MFELITSRPPNWSDRFQKVAGRIDWMMLFPALAALAWLLGEDAMAMLLVAVLPLHLALSRISVRPVMDRIAAAPDARPISRADLVGLLDQRREECARRSQASILLLMRMDLGAAGRGNWAEDLEERMTRAALYRAAGALRDTDTLLRLGEATLAVVLEPKARADLDVGLALADRVRRAVAEEVAVDGIRLRMRGSVGFCPLHSAPAGRGIAWLAAAECALEVASRVGPGTVRAFDSELRERKETEAQLAAGIEEALRDGQIRPWFQPQIHAATGAVSGVEVLARWHHPTLGVLVPGSFLPALLASGRSKALCEIMLDGALCALADWDVAGLNVPIVSINLSLDDLRDPILAEDFVGRIDKYGVPRARIAVEILETVTAGGDDCMVMQNLRSLRDAGIRLDLDDFGTGAASIAHLARFGVHRLKIDRSFISGLDSDDDRRRIVAAMLGLAGQLGIETVAEGVENPAERGLLVAMGCDHLQGFNIAHPMPAEDISVWLSARRTAGRDLLARVQVAGTA
jgi:EAL domain-containing protein (putative c-di-GMP-specific phosphodiesterase class I)/GGDEF domain-containing protein